MNPIEAFEKGSFPGLSARQGINVWAALRGRPSLRYAMSIGKVTSRGAATECRPYINSSTRAYTKKAVLLCS